MNASRHKGVSLVELMVGIVIALILLTGVITVMLRISTSGAESVTGTRLNQQLRAAMDQVTKELQRAGYVNWYDAWDPDGDDVFNDINGDSDVDIRDFYLSAIPRMDVFGSVSLWQFPTPGIATGTPVTCTNNCDCVLYSYDLNEDAWQGVGAGGTTGTGQNTAGFELFGFRWNDNALEMRTSGDSHSCVSGDWEDITDSTIAITNFSVSQSFASGVSGSSLGTGNDSTVYAVNGEGTWDSNYRTGCPSRVDDGSGPQGIGTDLLCYERRKLGILIEGQLADDPGVRAELRSDVKIKNDFLDALP